MTDQPPNIEVLYTILVQTARERSYMTYEDVSQAYLEATEDWHHPHGSWDHSLGQINLTLHSHGLPALSAVVTLKGDDPQPGNGFWGSCPSVPQRPWGNDERHIAWARILSQVHAADWPDEIPAPRPAPSRSSPRPRNRDDDTLPLPERVRRILMDQQAVVSADEIEDFVDELQDSIEKRNGIARGLSEIRDDQHILRLIQTACEARDLDEAVWRCFVATHFGVSACPCVEEEENNSASRLLCAFGKKPVWTWQKVSMAPLEFHDWLLENSQLLRTLTFGNHRKHEENAPIDLWKVVKSFIELAEKNDGPYGLVTLKPPTEDRNKKFDILYHRLRELHHFGRLGAFDLLVLLIDMKIVKDAEPGHCYLIGSTGPMRGARKLWDSRSDAELERLAAEFAKRVAVSPIAVEDALCNWQKQK